ncbi:MAG: TRAP transporter substrate-binding protein [Pseudodonghicola sp.]
MFDRLLSGAAAFAFLAAAPALADSWDIADEYPAGSLGGQTADHFARAVAEKTAGRIEVTVHHGGALGYRSVDQFDAVGDGALHGASSAFAFWGGIDPIFLVSTLPFITPTVAEARRLYEVARPDYAAVLEANEQVLLLATPWPSAGLWGNKAFISSQDLAGEKIRTYDVSSTTTLKNAGAFPIQLSWSDVPAQLSTNAIDGVLTSANGGVGIQLWELQSHFTNVNYTMSLQGIHLNKGIWDGLDDATRDTVLAAAKEAEDFGWSAVAASMEKDFATMAEHGVTVTPEIPAAFAADLAAAAQPFIDDWTAQTGDRGAAILRAYRGQ